MGDLSEHFNRREFACRGISCCGHAAPVESRLVEALEVFRARIGQPVHINCGFRCPDHNDEVGGSKTSRHMDAEAADIRKVPSMSIEEMAILAESVPAFAEGGIGRYETFLHVDVRTDGPARWVG